MNAEGDVTGLRRKAVLVVAVVVMGLLAGCGSSGGSGSEGAATTTTSTADQPTSTSATTTVAPSTTAGSTTTVTALTNASEAQRTAPSDGTGTALLKAVRVGRNAGFERIVYEFAGTSMPGYRVGWVEGPILADGSGEPVDVAGKAYLEMVMQPASGVDLSAPQLTVVYNGPDRIAVAGQTKLITDLVRTGDFEAVLTWVAGTTEKVPFRVLRLSNPTRIVVDLQTP